MRRDTAVPLHVRGRPRDPWEPTPLTERILARLPGPRLLWLVVWILVPFLHAAAMLTLQAAGELRPWENPTVQLVSRAAFSFAVLVSVWGAVRITRALGSLRSKLLGLMGRAGDPMEPFRGMASTAAPLLFTAAAVLIFGAQAIVAHGSWIRGIVSGSAWLLIGIPLWTFFWVYVHLQLGLDRLGRRQLLLEPYAGGRTLGLRPLGTLAFTGFLTFVLMIAPLLLAAVSDPLGLGLGLLVLLAGIAAFFLSLRRLNRQRVAVKERELARTRRLVAQAFRPVREEGTLEALQRRSSLLSAAQALEERAERIREWPFDEGTFRQVVAISSTVVAATIARVLLAPFGL